MRRNRVKGRKERRRARWGVWGRVEGAGREAVKERQTDRQTETERQRE